MNLLTSSNTAGLSVLLESTGDILSITKFEAKKMIVFVFVGHSYVIGIDPNIQIVPIKLSTFATANIFH